MFVVYSNFDGVSQIIESEYLVNLVLQSEGNRVEYYHPDFGCGYISVQ